MNEVFTLFNQIWFANEFVSVPCQNPINWNFLLENPQDPSTTRIVCDLPPREGSKGSDWFSLILKVDGEEVHNSFSIRYYSSYTPYIRQVIHGKISILRFHIACAGNLKVWTAW